MAVLNWAGQHPWLTFFVVSIVSSSMVAIVALIVNPHAAAVILRDY